MPNEIVNISFNVSRADLVELITRSKDYGQIMLEEVERYSTAGLLSTILQFCLYDSEDGPQLEGEYTIHCEAPIEDC